MNKIPYIDRPDGLLKEEKVFGEKAVAYLHGKRFDQKWIKYFVCRLPFVSALYGWVQRRKVSKKKVASFVQNFSIDMSEFKKSVSDFESFNDFFVREFKEGARPIFEGGACLPADARYRFFQNISKEEGFVVKGEKFCLKKFLGDEELAKRYDAGAMVMARLCPVDYHRFHFPCSGIAGKAKMINGKWFSVNPISLRENIHVMTENKRAITELDSEEFGKVLYVEIGATNVGSIVQTYEPGFVKKGEEKGYFGFGASALVILFEPGRVVLDADLIAATKQGLEIRALMGSSLGVGIAKK